MRWPWQRRTLPGALSEALDKDEQVLVLAELEGDGVLAASRFGLWLAENDKATRLGWELIAKASLTGATLSITPTHVVDELPDGTQVLVDEPVRRYQLAGRTGLTDVVHTRVRRSVAASTHLPHPGAGGWVVLRRVPGRDGLIRQVRLDPGAQVWATGFPAAVDAAATELESLEPQ